MYKVIKALHTNKLAVVKIFILCVLSIWFSATSAQAALFTISDLNSSITVDTDPARGGALGLIDWEINGTDHMGQEWYWYRVGNDPEASIDTIDPDPVQEILVNPETGKPQIHFEYSGTSFDVDLLFELTGWPAGKDFSLIKEWITIENTSLSSLDFHLFEYTDLDIGGPSGDTATFFEQGLIRQADFAALPSAFTVMVESGPLPDHWHIGKIEIPEEVGEKTILQALEDGFPTNLLDKTSPFSSTDVNFAFQWDLTILAGESVTIEKHKLVPEPASLTLLGIGFGVLGARRLRGRGIWG